jgi:hypothetical protein
MKKEIKTKSLKVQDGLHKQLKLHSAGTGLSIQAILEVAIINVTKLSYKQMEKVALDYYNSQGIETLTKLSKSKK